MRTFSPRSFPGGSAMLSEDLGMGSQIMDDAMMAGDGAVGGELGANAALWGPMVPAGPVNQGRWMGVCAAQPAFLARTSECALFVFYHLLFLP